MGIPQILIVIGAALLALGFIVVLVTGERSFVIMLGGALLGAGVFLKRSADRQRGDQ